MRLLDSFLNEKGMTFKENFEMFQKKPQGLLNCPKESQAALEKDWEDTGKDFERIMRWEKKNE